MLARNLLGLAWAGVTAYAVGVLVAQVAGDPVGVVAGLAALAGALWITATEYGPHI